MLAARVEQLGAQDCGGSVGLRWITPQQARRGGECRSRTLVIATQLKLVKQASYRTVAEAVSASRAAPLATVMPTFERAATSTTYHIPEAAGYGVSTVTINKPLGGPKST